MAFTKRQMLFVPEVNPTSFVFFFEKGNSGMSWSIRDYSIGNRVRVYRPGDFQWTADDIFQKARYAFNAPAHQTDDLAFWHKQTVELNQRHGLGSQALRPAPVLAIEAQASTNSFPVLDLEELMTLPKGRKSQDMDRILHSASSEDWVTWNFFQVLLRQCPANWWNWIVQAAMRRNPELDLPANSEVSPVALFWNLVHSPEGYLEESRRRMLSSRNPIWAARATASEPVEGPTEVDVTIESDEFLIFIEAKLGSDISMNTTYDPHRNQVARNIDCLLEKAGQKTPAFWMLVRDEDPSRAYVQLVNAYRSDPGLLARDLPHRRPEDLERMCQNLTILRWNDFTELVCGIDADEQVAAVKHDLGRRISGAGPGEQMISQAV
jgi:hypothetical protein